MRYLIASKLSEHIAVTREGFLLCRDVAIARTGVQEYAPGGDMPIEAAKGGGPIRVRRDPQEVFAPEAMASFEGKPVVVDHPDEDVTPVTWRELAVGHAQNVRRGEGVQSDLLLADLMITDKEAIKLVRGGLREISCGYDADYEEEAPGRGRQMNIRGNHIALVERGRCGGRCRINDNNEGDMAKKVSLKDKIKNFLRSLDEDDPPVKKPEDKGEEAAKAAANDEGEGETEERLSKLEAQLGELTILVRKLVEPEGAETATDEGEEAATGDEGEEQVTGDEGEEGKKPDPTKTGDRARAKARDARTVDADITRRAVALYPGLRVADSDKRCVVQRTALRYAARDAAMSKSISAMLGGSTLDNCDCVTLDAAFVAASEIAAARNNTRTADALGKASVRDFGKAVTPAAINQANRDFHAKKGA